MKIYRVFTANISRHGAEVYCRQYYPFSVHRFGYFGFYNESGWRISTPGEKYHGLYVYRQRTTEPELELLSVTRNQSCIDGTGDLLEWRDLATKEVFWSWAEYFGLASRVSALDLVLTKLAFRG